MLPRCVLAALLLPAWSPHAAGVEDDAREVLTHLHVLGDGPRGAGPVRGGIPLPASAGVLDPAELGVARELVDADGEVHLEPLAVQWRVLSRWGGAPGDATRPVRWVLADVDVADDAVLALTRGAPEAARAPAVAAESADGVVLDDGRLQAVVEDRRVAILAGTRVRASDFDPSRPTALATAGLDAELVVRGADGEERAFLLSADPAPVVVLEEAGPLRATVLVRAAFGDAAGVRLRGAGVRAEVRLGLRRGTASVDVDVALVNDSAEPLDVRTLRLLAPTRLTGAVACATADGELTAERVLLRQSAAPHAAAGRGPGLAYELIADGVVRARGARSDGALTIASGAGALSVAVRRFWETHPKEIAFEAGVLRVGLLGAGEEPHRVAPGRRVASSLRLSFAARDGRIADDVLLVPEPGWVSRSGALAPLAPHDADLGDAVATIAARHLERLQEGLIDVAACDPQGPGGSVPPASLVTQRERRGGANPALPYDVELYGWRRFGDLVDVDGPADGDHGWVRGLCRAYLARADARFLQAALDLARLRFETARETPGVRAVPGLLLLHALTGDERLTRAARDLVDGVDTDTAPRHEVVLACLARHAHLGDEAALRTALRVHGHMLAEEQRAGRASPTATDVLALRAHEMVHRATGDARALGALLHGLRRVLDEGYSGTGRAVGGAYLPLQLHGPDGASALHTPIGLALADRLAYAGRATGEAWYEERARAVFRDAVLFLQAPPMQLVGPGAHAAVSAAPLRHPGHEIAFGELLLDGAPWLLAGDAERVARGEGPAATVEPLLVETALATRRPEPREPVVGGPVVGEPVEPAEPGGDDVPPPPGPLADATTPAAVVLDDADAVLAGRWDVQRRDDAGQGAQSVSAPGSADATATFVVTVPFDGRARVYLLWQPVAGASARAGVVLDGVDGSVRLAFDTSRGAGRWRLLGEVGVRAATPLRVDVGRDSAAGSLAVDGLRVEPVR